MFIIFLIILSTIILLISLNFYPRNIIQHLELKPNCLITRKPIVFLTGNRSPFYFTHYWNQLPTFLREHGYEIQIGVLPWNISHLSYELFLLYLEKQNLLHTHLIGDSSFVDLFDQLAHDEHQLYASLTIIEKKTETEPIKASDLLPPKRNIFYISPKPENIPMSLLNVLFITQWMSHLLFRPSKNSHRSCIFFPPQSNIKSENFNLLLKHAVILAEQDLINTTQS